jgi:membrane protein
LRTIEATFNDIWGITHGRGWFSSIVQYWATISIGPVILVVALGLTSGPHFTQTAQFIEKWPLIGAVVFKLLPIAVLSLAFALFYQLMPNTKVQPLAALVGGVVGGTLWYLNNTFSIMYASKAVTYSKIYGSLGILPLFLVGMYLSWLILLFGAQVAYAYQNRQSYLQEKQTEGVHQQCREFVALRLMTNIAQHFQRGTPSPGVNQLAAALGVPTRLITHLIHPLVRAKLVVEVLDKEAGFTPARPLNQITAHDILLALRVGQGLDLETCEDCARGFVRDKFHSICDAEKRVADAMTLEALANEAPAVPVTAGVAQSA